MKTKTKKTSDAVDFMRRRREDIAKKIEGMIPEEEIAYFKKKASELKKRKS